jgi:hypothetical protein
MGSMPQRLRATAIAKAAERLTPISYSTCPSARRGKVKNGVA